MASALPMPNNNGERALLCPEEPPVGGFFVGETVPKKARIRFAGG